MTLQQTIGTTAARFRRGRLLAVAGTTAAVLAVGGLTACEPETPSGGGDSPGTQEPDEPGEAEEPGEADEGFLGAGETHVYENGLEITISAAEEFTPSDHIELKGTAYMVTVTVENSGDEDYTARVLYSARAGEAGNVAENIYDSAQLDGDPDGTVKPGRTLTGEIAFDVPDGADFIDVSVKPVDIDLAEAFWNLKL
jgi:hypothetical protein